MGMNVKTTAASEDDDDLGEAIAAINVTPLVDVMLVLLIIFMVTAPLMLSQVPITLPKAALQEMGKPRDPLIVSFDLQGNYYIESGGGHTEQLQLAQLPGRLHEIAVAQPDNLVYIRADKGAVFDKVRDLLKMAAAAGFYRVSLMSQAQQ
ncbi:MAG: biopolymer transporter ExbD [Nevskia sp.]|nr:biopolymer transporter ExbD [Nevskia sp.]